MTEKEKMMSGQLYDPNLSEELKKERAIVKDLCHEYNSLSPNEREKEHEVMKKILGKTKEHFRIHPSFWCDYGYNIEIGENFFSNYNLVILDCAKVTFGDNVAIGPNCGFYAVGHPLDPKERQKGLEYGLPITVGNNVWIGGGVNVMPGVTIGDNVVIGAGSVVTKDIESNSIAVGNPCRVIRKI